MYTRRFYFYVSGEENDPGDDSAYLRGPSERPAAVINSTAWQHYNAKVHHKIGPTLSFCVQTSDRRINTVKIDKTTRQMIYAD